MISLAGRDILHACSLAPKLDHLFSLNFDQGPIAACH